MIKKTEKIDVLKLQKERTWTFIYGRKPPTEEDWMRYIRFIPEGSFKK